MMGRNFFPNAFMDLPKDAIERIWDEYLNVASGVYLKRPQFDKVFGVVDLEVKIFADEPGSRDQPRVEWDEAGPESRFSPLQSDALQQLFVLYELPNYQGWVDGIEVLAGVILSSGQLSRREKLLLLRDRCLLFSKLNVASVINGASLAWENRRHLASDEDQLRCHPKDIDTWADKFPHKKILIMVEVQKTGSDVVEQYLKIAVDGKVYAFDSKGVAQVYGESGSKATIGSWELKLKTGLYTLRGKTEYDQAVVKVVEKDGLNEKGDLDNDSDDEEDREFEQRQRSTDPVDSDGSLSPDPTDGDSFVFEKATIGNDSMVPDFAARHQVAGGVSKATRDKLMQRSKLEWNYGMDNDVGAKQIASGEIIYASGRFIIVEDLLHIKPNTVKKNWPMHTDKITALEVHPNGRWIFSAQQRSNKVLVWDAQKMQLLGSIDTIFTGAKKLSISKCGGTLFMYSGNKDRAYCFYDTTRPDAINLRHSNRLPTGMIVNAAEMLTKDEAILVGSDVVRLASDGSYTRMRWGKTAPKALQDSLAVIYGTRSCVTASSTSGTVYLWSADTCTNHITFANKQVCSLSICHGNGPNSIACGLSDGTIQMVASRNLELLGANKQDVLLVDDSKLTLDDYEKKYGSGSNKNSTCSNANNSNALLVDADPSERKRLVSLHCGLSGLLVGSSNGSLFWYSFKAGNTVSPWTLLKVGHGGNLPLKWCWCGHDLLATAGDDQQLRVWQLPSAFMKEEDTPKRGLVLSKGGLQSPVTAIAGDKSRVFVALQDRTIQVVDIRVTNVSHSHVSTYEPIISSLPLIDRLAASDNLVATCCTKARMIEIRSFPSGHLVSKLRFNPSSQRLANQDLRFVETENGETVLLYGDAFAWDVKKWTALDRSKLGKLTDDAHKLIILSSMSSSLLLFKVWEEITEELAGQMTRNTQIPPPYSGVCCIPRVMEESNPSTSAPYRSQDSQQKAFSIVSVNGKAIRAVGVHPDWSRGAFAIGTDQPFIQVHDYKLKLDSPAQAVAFDAGTLLAVATDTKIYLFDWYCGVLLASGFFDMDASTTLGLAIAQMSSSVSDGNGNDYSSGGTIIGDTRPNTPGTPHRRNGTTNNNNAIDVVCRIDGRGDIQVWKVDQDKLVIDATKSVIGSNARCITNSGYYGTDDGKIHNLLSGKENVAEHAGGINALFEDKLGFLSAGKDGTIRAWTSMMQHIPFRKGDKVKYTGPIVGIYRSPLDNKVVLRTADGSVYADNELVPPQEINKDVVLAELRQFRYIPGSSSSSSNNKDSAILDPNQILFMYRTYTDRKVCITSEKIFMYKSSDTEFVFDDPVKLATISGNGKVVAVATVTNDIYILDANTCILLYYWSTNHIGCEIESLRFRGNGEGGSGGADSMVAPAFQARQQQSSNIGEDLFVNKKPFIYKC